MNAPDFVSNVVRLKQELLELFVGEGSNSEVAARLAELALTAEQRSEMKEIVNAVLRDTLYTVLLGLDGAASIGGSQQAYQLTDQSGSVVYRAGELEAEAWRQLHNGA